MHKETKGKLKLNLVPIKALKAVARVREFGCNKYPSPDGRAYLEKVKSSDLIEAARRHLLAHLEGDLLDNESSEMHLSHAATSLMMAIEIHYTTMEWNDVSLRVYQELHKGIYGCNGISKEIDWKDIPDGRNL